MVCMIYVEGAIYWHNCKNNVRDIGFAVHPKIMLIFELLIEFAKKPGQLKYGPLECRLLESYKKKFLQGEKSQILALIQIDS